MFLLTFHYDFVFSSHFISRSHLLLMIGNLISVQHENVNCSFQFRVQHASLLQFPILCLSFHRAFLSFLAHIYNISRMRSCVSRYAKS